MHETLWLVISPRETLRERQRGRVQRNKNKVETAVKIHNPIDNNLLFIRINKNNSIFDVAAAASVCIYNYMYVVCMNERTFRYGLQFDSKNFFLYSLTSLCF